MWVWRGERMTITRTQFTTAEVAPHCTERGCVFPALVHGVCLHHLRMWGGKPERFHPQIDSTLCDCGKACGHRGRCFGEKQVRCNSPKHAVDVLL